MLHIAIEDLIIPENRQRKVFPEDKEKDLQSSILSKGLMHAPVVQNDGKTLVAGERRVRALTKLHEEGKEIFYNGAKLSHGYIPVVPLKELSEYELREAELEENTIRLDITWQEKAAALEALYDLRQAQATEEGKPYVVSDLVEEVTGQRDGNPKIREALVLAKHLDIPEVQKAKTQKEAVKVLKKIKSAEQRAILAEEYDIKQSEHILHHGDLRELLKKEADGTFDLILADPPYGIDADDFGSMASTGHNYNDSKEYALELYTAIAFEGIRVCKPEAHVYVFCSFELFSEIKETFEFAGWTVWAKPLIWAKGNGMLPYPEHGPRYTYECILFANKGNKKVHCIKPDVIQVPAILNNLTHGAQKPVDLYLDLMARSCLPNAKVLDCCAGSGTIFEAATVARCIATGYEFVEANYNICVERIANAKKGLDINV